MAKKELLLSLQRKEKKTLFFLGYVMEFWKNLNSMSITFYNDVVGSVFGNLNDKLTKLYVVKSLR